MANILQRIIQLVLDKESAKQVQKDTEDTTSKMEQSWKSMAAKIAGYLGVAFLTHKIIEFGKASVEEAVKSQAAWAALGNTIDNTGASFTGMEKQLRATADAFQEATIHDDDAFAESLNRLVTLTDDVSASLNNMGLVANVAAKFFKGDLESATDLVAKAMNGNTNALKKMGIQAESAQQALDILAKRSMGAAAKEAETAAGQAKQLGNAYDDLKKSVGEAIINSDGATNAFTVLKSAVAKLTEWVDANKETVSKWVTEGIKFAIDAADVFIRAVWGMANVLKGGFQVALGLTIQTLGDLLGGIVALRKGIDAVQEFLGVGNPEKAKKETQALDDQAEAMRAWGKSAIALGSEAVQKGIDTLSTPLFSSDQFTGLPNTKTKLPGEGNAPQVGKNVKTDEGEAVKKALKEFNDAARAAANMSKILGDRFDATGAEVDRTTKLLNVLAANGIQPAAVGMTGLGERLRVLTDEIVPTQAATKELNKSLGTEFVLSALNAVQSINPFADRLASLTTQQADVLKAITTLTDAGIDPQSDSVQRLADTYLSLGEDIKQANVQSAMHDLAQTLQGELFQATLDHASQLEMLQIEHAALQKTIQTLISQGVDKEDAAFKKLTARYEQTTEAIKKQTVAMQFQAAAADFLADALGAALQGGLAEAAAQKAKQNAIEAAEMLVRAGVFALFGDFPHATASLALAAQFGAVSLAWAALGAASKGGGGGSSAPSIPSTAAGGGGDITSGRTASSDAANKAAAPGAEVSIYLTGPGFHAMNPEVQKVVRGAQQQAQERFGNARVRVVSTPEA